MVLLTVYVSVKVPIVLPFYTLADSVAYFEYFGIAYRKYNSSLHEYRNYSATMGYLIPYSLNIARSAKTSQANSVEY